MVEGDLYRIVLTQEELHEGDIVDITHCFLHDSGIRIAVDVSTGVNAYTYSTDENVGVLEGYLTGEKKSRGKGYNVGVFSRIT